MSVQQGDNRPIVYGEGEKYVYRASSCGSCSKALVAARMGLEPTTVRPDWLDQAAQEGKLHESSVVERLQSEGFVVTTSQEVIEIPLPSAMIRGHIDGKATYIWPLVQSDHLGRTIPSKEPMLLEIKTMSDTVFSNWCSVQFAGDTFYRYAVQFSLYMYATKLPGLFVVKNRNNGEMRLFYYAKPPIEPRIILKRMVDVEFAAREGKMPEVCDRVDFFCGYSFLCDKPEQRVLQGVNELAVNAWSKQYVEASEMEKKYANMKSQARENLLGLMNYQPSPPSEAKISGMKINSGKFTVSAYEMERESVSLEIMRSVFGDEQVAPYVVKSRFPVLRVKDKGAKSKGAK